MKHRFVGGCFLGGVLAWGSAPDAIAADCAEHAGIIVASKPFTESYLLSEIIAQIIESTGETKAIRKFGLGGPQIVVDGLINGELDVDANYTGSLALAMFPNKRQLSDAELRAALHERGLRASQSIGFNNTYALAIRTETARKFALANVSDLKGHEDLRGAFTPDFLNEEDGFYRLQNVYGFHLQNTRPMQHALAYAALASREIDLTDAYTTDGALAQFDLTLLRDDREFFPKYLGVVVMREKVADCFPKTWQKLLRLEGKISDQLMTDLNAAVDVKKRTVPEVARGFLVQHQLVAADAPAPSTSSSTHDSLWSATIEHLGLVCSSLVLSCLLGIPLGILATQYKKTGQILIALTGLFQTIPSLALLCFLIPVLGIGALPTVFALFIYGLLPIAQSTTTGLFSLDPKLLETAKILGLSRGQRLRLVELPLASRSILSGIKTTAVINVGTATIAAMIGAGGYGRFITSGLAMNDVPTILRGAIPTALMAVAFHALFELSARWVIPKGLRIDPTREN
ncbi:MAG TPA: glycine betaine ABC transporter substrate-binding protein [Polyangium sp.]|nr:glycine betaine ABC transporter substrate-binding protein [Polyangium sp.]